MPLTLTTNLNNTVELGSLNRGDIFRFPDGNEVYMACISGDDEYIRCCDLSSGKTYNYWHRSNVIHITSGTMEIS